MKKIFTIWAGATVTILISVPGIAAIIEISHQAAKITYVSNHGVVAVVILVTGYALIWKTFTALDQVAGKIGGVVQSATGRMQQGLSKYQGNTMKRRLGEAVEGNREIRGARLATNLVRRGKMADEGGLTPTRAAQRRYQGARRAQMQRNVAEMMKRDGGRSGGDDDLMEIVMSEGGPGAEGRIYQRYRQHLMNNGTNAAEATRIAGSRVGDLKSNFGAEVGSEGMRVAAWKSLLDSKTSYTDPTGANGQDNWERIVGDANQLMADGLITSTDATMAIKQRGDRADRAGVGFGTLQSQIERSFERYQGGARRARPGVATAANPTGSLVTDAEAKAMRKEALFGTPPGAVVGGRHEAVSALGGTMLGNIEETYQNVQAAAAAQATAVASGNAAAIARADQDLAQAQEQLDRELAATAGRYDAMAQVSPQNATIMANNVMSQVLPNAPVHPTTMQEVVMDPTTGNPQIDPVTNRPVTRTVPSNNPRAGQPMTVQEMIEASRGNNGFLEMRREYMNQGIAGAQAAAMAAAGAGAPGGGGNGPPSDRRLKRNIEPIAMHGDIQLYRFQYLWSDQTYVGVMAQDLLETYPHAVGTDNLGFYFVDYTVLGTKMYTIEEWQAQQRTATAVR